MFKKKNGGCIELEFQRILKDFFIIKKINWYSIKTFIKSK
jgi:hypothetical protein